MAENKQYIIQAQEGGSLLISEDVISTIVARAIEEVEGIVGLVTKPGSDIAEIIGKKNWGKGITITVNADNEVSIDCNVTVSYGQSVVAVAKDIQAAIHNSVEELTGVVIANVNVNICGIVRQ